MFRPRTAEKRVQLPASFQAVEDLLLWENPAQSGLVLGAATALYILLEWSGIPLVTWLSNLALCVVVAAVLWAFGARFMGVTGPSEHLPPVLKTGLDEGVVRTLADKARGFINHGLAILARLLSGEEPVLAAKSFAGLWIAGWVGRYITPIGLLYTTVLALFSLPKLYEMRKDEIDAGLGRARDMGAKHYGTARDKTRELINRLTPQKGPRPASSSVSAHTD